MADREFRVVGTADFRAILEGFKQVQAGGVQAGRQVEDSLKRAGEAAPGAGAKVGQLGDSLGKVGTAAGVAGERLRDATGRFIKAGQALGGLGDEAGQTLNQLRVLDGVIQGVAFSLSNSLVNAAAATAASIQKVVGDFGRLDTELRKAAAAGGEAGGYDRLATVVDRVGIEAAGTQLEVAELATSLTRAGFSIKQVEGTLPGVVRGAEATGTAFDQMGNIVGSTLRGFGLEVDQTNRVVDVLVNTANASNASIEGLGYTMQYAAPVAKALNVSLEDVAAASGLMANAGIDASVAGTGLRTGLERLQKAAAGASGEALGLGRGSEILTEAMRALGANVTRANGELLPLDQALIRLKAGFDALATPKKVELASALFGDEAGSKFLAVLNQSTTDIQKMFDTIRASSGATDTARDAMQGFELKLQQLDGTLGSIGNVFGRVTAAALVPFIDAANLIVGGIAALPAPVKNVAAALTLVTGGFVAARVAAVIFSESLRNSQVQQAIAALKDLGTALRTRFVADVAIAKAAWIAFRESVQTGQMQSQILALGQKFGPFVLAAASAALAVKTFQDSTESAGKIAEGAGERQNKLTEALTKAGIETGKLTTLNGPLARALEDTGITAEMLLAPIRAIPGIGGLAANALKGIGDTALLILPGLKGATEALGGLYNAWRQAIRDADTTQGIEQANVLLGNLQQQAGLAQNAAAKLFFELRKGGEAPNPAQLQQIEKLRAALNATTESVREQRASFQALAAVARNSGNKELAAELERKAELLNSEIKLKDALIERLDRAAGSNRAGAKAIQQAADETKKLTAAATDAALKLEQAGINAQKIQLASQVNDSLLGLGQALQGLEQSRFDIAKARNQFEVQAAQQRGASETEIEAIKRNGQLIEAQALQARAQSLLSIQELERQSLSLTQERARIDADLAVQGARVKQLEAEAAVQEAIGKGDERATALAQQKLELAQQVVQLEIQRRETLAQTQPIEQQIAAAGAEKARNALQAQAAAMGLRLEANGTVAAMQGVNQSFQVLATSQGLTEGGQRRLRELAAATGLEVRQAADGTIQIGRSLGAAGTPAGQLVEALKNAADPAGAISGSFVKLGEKAPAAVQGSRDFAGYLSSAAGYSKQVSDPRIAGEVRNAATQAGSLADKMRTSASSAQSFYQSLLQASALPGSRWTGGPVEAGTSYRINELGQESLLGPGGRLSLINAPANSLWRAPRPGVVLPAGVTAQLKEQGVFGGGAGASLRGAGAAVAGGGAAEVLAQQAVEIGRLRQAISELARKTWNVGVKVRSDGSAVSFLNQMGRMR
jgi:TP901 family phage tail tape measure protein